MSLSFSETAWEHYVFWQSQDKSVVKKINRMLKEIQRHPFEGTGKPEPLKGNLSGFWSRRITQEHRLVYEIKADEIKIHQCRFHY